MLIFKNKNDIDYSGKLVISIIVIVLSYHVHFEKRHLLFVLRIILTTIQSIVTGP